MTPVYFISGLGADETVFSRLQLKETIEIHHLPWLAPNENETMEAYALRMGQCIEDPQSAVLVGLSFGGIMAIEIAKRIPLKQVVLISSVKSKTEMPINLNLIGLLHLQKLLPASKLLHFKELTAWFFGVREGSDKEMLFDLLERSDERIVNWSADKVVSWDGDHNLSNISHIHGTADAVFPIRNVRPDKKVQGGPHFMVYTHPDEVSAWLNEVI
ncbi:MAG: alpha/beta hydrolase [Flavobacteriales bacterium]|nr:alpha/beta hydrolase [Flavobacteriales bacterium]